MLRRRPVEQDQSPPPSPSPAEAFRNPEYLRHNQRRQQHLAASLGLPLAGRSVLELGAGIGDHSTFFLDRDCRLTITEAREPKVEILHPEFPLDWSSVSGNGLKTRSVFVASRQALDNTELTQEIPVVQRRH